MLTNYVKIAWRNLAKNRFFSALNILGLSLGMTCCLTMILLMRDQLSYDHFHNNSDRIFRVICEQEGMKIATVPYPIEAQILEHYGIAASGVRLVRSIQGVDATSAGQLTLPLSGFYTEASFFEIFGFRLEAGNAATALKEPNSIVLSKKTAEKFFGTENPLGKTLTLQNKGNFVVTGVVATPAGKTHISFDCLVSAPSLTALEKAYKPEEAAEKVIENWENRYSTYVYFLLQPGKNKADLDQALASISDEREKVNKNEKGVRYKSQNLSKITPKPGNYANELGGGAPWFFIWGLLAFVVLLTIFPCLNYSNMVIAQALSRAREVGVRKAIGASAGDVRRLIWAEAILSAFIALLLSFVLHLPLNQFVASYFPPGADLEGLGGRPMDWLIFIGFALLVGLLAGWIPARRLAKLNTLQALRSSSSGLKAGRNRLGWRTLMMGGQFTLALVFMIFVSVIWSQMRFMTLADYGFQKENLLTIELQGNKAGVVAAEMTQDPHVNGVCMTSVVLASNNLQGISLYKDRNGDDLGIHCAMVDEQYIPVLGLQLLAGENFDKRPASTKDEFLIVNEQALSRFQLGSPQEAIGKVLWMNDSTPVAVRGVLKDFHYRILDNAIEPFALRYSPTENGYIMHARIAPGDPRDAMASLAASWKKIDSTHPFKGVFMEESMQKSYGHVALVGGLMSFFALLALSLACIGLLGMVTFTVHSRVKEIGIRKVLGASVANVTLSLSRYYLILLTIATLIAIPVGFFLSNQFLQLFAYRISVGAVLIGGSVVIVLGLALLAIGVQAVRAALSNPVEALKSE